MSGGQSIANTGDHIEFIQPGRETLTVTSHANPTLLISQDGGAYVTLQSSVQNLILSETSVQTLLITEQGGDTLLVSDNGTLTSPYGHPHTTSDDGVFYYYAWQHTDGTRWKAQRLDLSTLDLRTITGANPQPDTLVDFQNLSF